MDTTAKGENVDSTQVAMTVGEHSGQISALQTDVTEIKGDVKKLLALKQTMWGAWRSTAVITAVVCTVIQLAYYVVVIGPAIAHAASK